jgi:hypothetical protein
MMEHLLETLLLPEPQARQAWERWRASINIDTLSYASQQLLPAVIPVLPEWLEQDPASGIFKGIVRRIWSQNQLRLRLAVELNSLLTQAAGQPIVAGPLAWSLRTRPPAIRVIPHLTFLVPRSNVRDAADALIHAGWEPHRDLPLDQALDWIDHVRFHRENVQLNLHWRLVVVPPEDALACERSFLSRVDGLPWNQHLFETTSLETTMLHILCGQRDGDLPWQADVALVGTAGVDWTAFLKLARRFSPLAIERLRELRSLSRLAVPPLAAERPGPLRRKCRFVWKAYRAHAYYRKEALTWSGLAAFLAISFARKYVLHRTH